MHQVGHAQKVEFTPQALQKASKIQRRITLGQHPDQAMAFDAGQGDQIARAFGAGIKGLGMRHVAQRAVEPVRPAVVTADQACAVARGAGVFQQAHAAMPADVEEAAHDTLRVARNQQRQAVAVMGQHLPRREFACMGHDQRLAAKQRLHFGCVNRRVEVTVGRDVVFGRGVAGRGAAAMLYRVGRREQLRAKLAKHALRGRRRAPVIDGGRGQTHGWLAGMAVYYFYPPNAW